MKQMILACSSLTEFIEAAQEKMNTAHPVWYLDKKYHMSPKMMRKKVIAALEEIPEEYDTILVAMGYCGGSWEKIDTARRIVVPRIDDCISLLMTLDDEYHVNRKTPGHIYVKEENPREISIKNIYEHYTAKMEKETALQIMESWKRTYEGIDIIDTGLYDCYDESYLAEVKKDADWLEAEVKYVPGGTHLIEKLVSGRWDEQFAIIEPGEAVGRENYFG